MFNPSVNSREKIDSGVSVEYETYGSLRRSTTCPSRTDLQTIFGLASVTDLYMGVYGNADPSNVTGHWVRVTSCTSEIGSSSPPDCQPGFLPNPSATQCYMRLDIQIAYANIGSVTNPQPVLGAVVFHYQRTVRDSLRSSSFCHDIDLDDAHITIADQSECYFSRCVGRTGHEWGSDSTSECPYSRRFLLPIVTQSSSDLCLVLVAVFSADAPCLCSSVSVDS